MTSEWRVACVRIPRFPIGAVQRARRLGKESRDGAQLLLPMEATTGECSSPADERHWDEALVVLSDGAPTRPKLRAVSAAAAREGVRSGMSLSEARALCGTLEVWTWDDDAVSAGITTATASFVEASPQVSPVAGAPGMWWIGASGFAVGARAAGGAGERAFAHMLLTLAQRWHPCARVAIADTCVAARAATWASASFRANGSRKLVTIVPPGGDAAYLASAPLALLPVDDEIRDTLRALGVRTVGQFAELDAADVEQRWGDEGLVAWRLAHGDDPRRPVLARVEDHPHVELELDAPSTTMEPVLFLARPAVEHLVAQMVSQGRAIASLAVTLTLDDARGSLPWPCPAPGARASAVPHTVTREIRLPRPLARPAPLFERCRGLLARWTLTAPVTAVRLTVLLTSPLTGEQGNLLNTSWKDPGAADAALERLRAELGPGVVVKPAARDGYVPERAGEWHEDQAVPHASHPAPGTSRLVSSAVRLLANPERVDVDRDPDPRRIFWRGRALTVASAVGPERLSGDWWRDGYGRDYWRCESDEECGELVLYRDAAGWWVQGWYD